MADPIRVALCDDHAVVRSGLHHILAEQSDIEVVGEAATIAEAVILAAKLSPDVFLMDIALPDGSGIQAVARLAVASPSTRVVMLTMHDDTAYLRHAFDAGAAGYLLKEAADIELVLAVRQVAAGGQYVDPRLGAALVAPNASPARPSGPGGELSAREVEVLRCIALGMTNSEIAEELYVSLRTIETHRAHIQQKLGVRTRAELVRVARDAGILDDPSAGRPVA